jgi:transcriptional regulator with XRE-family HTH domain
MAKYDLTIIASGIDVEDEGLEDRFYEAGCSDATISHQKGVVIVEFRREAKSFLHALVSAIMCVLATGAKIERVEPDHLVSLSDIAKRTGLSRAALSLYAKGERAQHFPGPIARVTSESPLWDWLAVTRWMYLHDKLDRAAVLQAKAVREANIAVVTGFEHHRLAPFLKRHDEPAKQFA